MQAHCRIFQAIAFDRKEDRTKRISINSYRVYTNLVQTASKILKS